MNNIIESEKLTERVLYLFNSAIRPVFRENVQKILALPSGNWTRFRYKLREQAPDNLCDFSLVDRECYIIFVDRYAERDYVYYPIRKGIVKSAIVEDDIIFIDCELNEICFTEKNKDLTKSLRTHLNNPPRLIDGDPTNTNDGFYAQVSIKDVRYILEDNDKWKNTVESLLKTKSFNDIEDPFIKVSFSKEKYRKGKIITNENHLLISSGDNYKINIFYHDPKKGAGNRRIKVFFGDTLRCNYNSDIRIGASNDLISLNFRSISDFRFSYSSINISVCKEDDCSFYLDIPIKTQSYRIIFGSLFYGLLFILFLFLEKYMTDIPLEYSLFFEIAKWAIAFRVFLKLGQLPFSVN
jgi:hypothetical protein